MLNKAYDNPTIDPTEINKIKIHVYSALQGLDFLTHTVEKKRLSWGGYLSQSGTSSS